MAFRHGKNGSAKVGATVLKLLSWAIEDAVDYEDSSNTASGGHKEQTGGLDGLEATFEAQWDATAGPFDSPPALIPGTQLANVNCYVGGSTNNGYLMPLFDVKKVSTKMVVKNVVTYTVSGASNGTFTRPTT